MDNFFHDIGTIMRRGLYRKHTLESAGNTGTLYEDHGHSFCAYISCVFEDKL